MADQNRTVQVALQLVYDPRSARAFAQMAQEAAKASKAVQKEAEKSATAFQQSQENLFGRAGTAANLGAFGYANRLGRMGGFAQGLESLGFGGAATGLSRAAPALALAGGSLNLAEYAAKSVYDRYSTQDQKNRALVRDILPGGEYLQGKFDAFSGRAAGMEQAGITGQMNQAAARARVERSQFALGFNPRQAGAEALSGAFRGQSAIAPGIFDRLSAEGERRFREEQRILPLKQAEARAEREAKVATAERVASQKELERITSRTTELVKERTRLERTPGTSGVKEQQRLLAIERVNAELDPILGQQRAAREGVMGATRREAEAKAERERAQLRTRTEGEAVNLEARVDTARSAGRRLGGMNAFDRAYGLQNARLIKARGSVEGLPEEIIQSGLGFAPEYIGAIIEKTGRGSAEFKAGFKEFGAADFGTLDAAGDSKRAQELRGELAKGEFAIDARVAEQIAASGRDFGKFVGDVINQSLERAKSEILNTVRLGRNAN